jgi:hypothetical protein
VIPEAGRKNTAECRGVYQLTLRDASIKGERARVRMFRASLPVVVESGDERLSYPLAKAMGGGRADRADHGVHGVINSNSSNDDNDVPGGSDACIAGAVRNNRRRARCSKSGAERNKQVAHTRALR